MAITTTHLTRAAGLSAVAAGLLFAGVQLNHPALTLDFITTTEFAIRQTMKVAFTVLALVGITGMYLAQVRKSGVLGLVGYLILAAGFLTMLTIEVAGLVILPALVHSAPGYVSDVIAVATNSAATGDIGRMATLSLLGGVLYMAGGLVFGIALYRAHVLARWACVLLAVATPISIAIPLLPWINQRLFAVPTGVALVGLGYSLWRQQRTQGAVEPSPLAESAGVR
ncbi:MAG: hypothetical protein WAL91_05605 [Propionicimonas sp.]